MDFETRARSAAQDINRAVEVMEMSTKTDQPRKVERFDQYKDRKNRNRKVGALTVAAAVAVIVAVVAVSSTRTNDTQVGVNPAISWPISPPGTGAFTVDLTTGTATPLPASLRDAGNEYAVSPDHKLVAYDAHHGDGLFIANIDGTGERQISFGSAMGPQWSPDGSMLVYQQRPSNPASTALGNLFIYDVRTGRKTQITHLDQSTRTGGWWFMFPSFMPTDRGPAVLFQKPRGTNPQVWDLWSVPVSGGKPVIVQKEAGWGAMNSSGKIAYAKPGDISGVGLVVRSLQPTGPSVAPIVETVWVPGVFDPTWVRWSPDGTRVAYSGKDGIHVLNVTDFSVTKVVKGDNAEWFDDNTLVVGN